MRTAIAEGVEYVDLEDDVAASIPRFGRTKRIISLHDFRKTPDNLDEIHRRLCGLDPDIVKICTMANHPHDNLRMLELIRRSKVPTIGLCMGDIGMPTRILAGKFGAPFTYATFHHERVLAPGQLSFQQMTEIYHYDQIDADTEVYGVIADPIGHSLSPLIHNVGLPPLRAEQGLHSHSACRARTCRGSSTTRRRLGIRGLSVTIPHKEEVVKKLTEADGAVRGIGAANTVVFDGKKRLGYNTDYRAAMDSLEAALGGAEEVEQRAEGQDRPGARRRRRGQGHRLRPDPPRRQRRGRPTAWPGRPSRWPSASSAAAVEWAARHSVAADLLFNCTPVGMHPNVDETPFEKHHLRPSMIVFDAVYNPENTLLVKEARSRNCTVVTGVDMFVRQACLQFELFTGQEGPADLMRETIRRAIGAAKY